MLASLLLLLPTAAYIPPVAIRLHCGTTAFVCVHAIASFPAVTEISGAGISAAAGVPAIAGVPAVAGIPAVAGFLAVTGVSVSATITAVFVG